MIIVKFNMVMEPKNINEILNAVNKYSARREKRRLL